MTDPTREKMVTALRDALAQGPMRERAMDALEDDLLYEAKRITDILLAKGVPLPEPPAPAAPPRPTWKPSPEAWEMMFRWLASPELSDDFLRRLYAQLHRDRVAALPKSSTASVVVQIAGGGSWYVRCADLLALADDGNGA